MVADSFQGTTSLTEQDLAHSLQNDSHLGERGSIDAALTLIPLTILFLLLVQLILVGSKQTSESYHLHDFVIRSQIAEGARGQETFDLPSNEKREIKVNQRLIEGIGTITSYELESEIPIFGVFLDWIGSEWRLRNFHYQLL